MGSPGPMVDDGVRQRLTARFGDAVEAWFDELPGVLSALAERWRVELGSPIPRGSVSVVIRCRMSDGGAAVLKVSPDRPRLAHEAAALDRWMTVHRDGSTTVLLHGDLTPSNILDGDDERGLVAIDPAPCLGDAAFDAIDLILWQADDVETVKARVEMVASAIDADAERLLDWCRAFAGMTALELAGSPLPSPTRIGAVVTLAAQAPTA
jgi:hypothetical protein